MQANEILINAAKTWEQRNAVYGDSYHQFGNVMMSLFPDGLNFSAIDDWNRFGVLIQIISKLIRYCNNFTEGGHKDSIHDLMVYAAMLEELDSI